MTARGYLRRHGLDLSDTEALIRDSARRIATERIAPLAAALDRGEGHDAFLANLKLLADNGFMGFRSTPNFAARAPDRSPSRSRDRGDRAACASTGVTASVTPTWWPR